MQVVIQCAFLEDRISCREPRLPQISSFYFAEGINELVSEGPHISAPA